MNALRPHQGTHRVDRGDLIQEATAILAAGNRLAMISCRDDGSQLRVIYTFAGDTPHNVSELIVFAPGDDSWVPSLAALSYPAGNFEREMRDLYGLRPVDHPQPHRLVRHGHWPRGWYPMRHDATEVPVFEPDTESFPFLEVEGHGVYEIAVGPIHAGIIDPGHFRFSVIGESIIRVEARQWYMHRGIEKLFEGRTPEAGIELAEAIAGDTVMGHSLAYVMAVEAATGTEVSESDRLLRALLLELERMYNHVIDLGALANDAGFGVINSYAGRLREILLRINKSVTGHRYLRGAVTIGGARVQQLPDPEDIERVARELAEIVDITLDHSVVRDRFTGTGTLPADQAIFLGTLGYVARASGGHHDARQDHPFADLGEDFHVVTETGGDVLSRYRVRAEEFAVSSAVAIDLIRRLGKKPGSGLSSEAAKPGEGLALVEAARGTICHRVEIGKRGLVTRLKVVDPSFFNWPALPIALADTIVPDFPLVNKSFGQSYAGNDL